MWWGLALIVVCIAVLVWYFGMGSKPYAREYGNNATTSAMSGEEGATTTLPTGSATSNAALRTDLNAIDSQMSGFSSDSANVNSSMSDQQVQQSSL